MGKLNGAAAKRNIFEDLKMSIMQGTFKPRERLIERNLAARFAVSRTPIREALHKLAAMGMVRIIPNQGAMVADFSLQDIESLYFVRLHLERLAGRLACSKVTKEEINTLVTLNQGLKKAMAWDDFSKMVEKDQQFHLTLIRFSKNPFLIKAIEDLRLKSYPFSYYYWRSNQYLRSSLADHNRMIHALRNRDFRLMDTLIEGQLNNSKSRYLKYLAQT
ncbi:MAG TPA: GntR family transcriptional regulator [Thermodesulfobacteriota bacterium]|nr:GntR family transcriptional regulator [Thermodesulfobacteriota bacterium]